MSVSNKIKALLLASDKSQADLAKYIGVSAQALSNKMTRGTFSSDDLIKIAGYCDCNLSYTLPDGSKINLTLSDLPLKEEKN